LWENHTLQFKSILFLELRAELDVVSRFSEIVPNMIIFDDFDRYLFLFGYLSDNADNHDPFCHYLFL
jgi:hypothetical protein